MHRIGTIPFDIKGDAMALLFVTSQTRGRWILPKGLGKAGETHEETGHRECFEEAGVRGVILPDFPITVAIGRLSNANVEKIPVTYYPLLVLEQLDDWPEKHQRQRHWALIEDAPKVTYRDDYRLLIKHFDTLRPFVRRAAEHHKTKRKESQKPAR